MSRSVLNWVRLAILVALCGAAAAQAQTIGTPPFGSYAGGPFDAVNLGNLNVHFGIPIRHKAGRGLPFSYDLSYDSTIWTPVTSGANHSWQPAASFGWQGLNPSFVGSTTYSVVFSTGTCFNGTQQTYQQWTFSNFVFHALDGTSYPVGIGGVYFQSPGGSCPPPGQQITGSPATVDGYKISVTALGAGSASATISDANGTLINDPANTPPSFTDRNGNQILQSSGTWTDTLGTTALSVTGAAPSNTVLSYTAPSGVPAQYTVSYLPHTVTTAFLAICPGITDYNTANIYLVDKVTKPDGTFYQFQYEDTVPGNPNAVTARVSQVTLPTGGTIQYTYGPINCTDGTATTLTRILNPGGTWSYARAKTGSDSHWQTTMTDPTAAANVTVIDFQSSFYETQRVVHQGSGTGPVLSTAITCYNTAAPTPTSCPTTAVSGGVNRRTTFSYMPDMTGVAAETDTQYVNGDINTPTEVDSYDYGTIAGGVGALLRKVVTTYGAIGNAVLPTAVNVEDMNSNIKASTTYSYDQVAVAPTTGTPNHTSVSTARGNVTTITTQVSETVNLVRRFTYYDTGTPNTATDPGLTSSGGPNITTYHYDNSGTPPHACGNSFVTSISEPLSLSRSFTWDCNGGVMTSITDENSKTATVFYTGTGNPLGAPDPFFWRPFGAQDQLSVGTSFSYPSVVATESRMSFNGGNSVVDHRTTLDAFGRPILSQTQQAPGTGPGTGNYDSLQTAYDSVGRVSEVFQPYSAAAGTPCSGTCPGTTTSYDALSRPLTGTDGGGGTISYSYNFNDVQQTVSPAPTGEHTKIKQLEYDGLGRLSSVCEVTSATGSGNCGQHNSQTGFWTKYTYDLLGDITGVTQNAQAASGSQQSRSYMYDMLGRLASELNPETGISAITYVYDSWDASCGSYTSASDLVEKKDAMGNVTCMKYDGLHRITDVTYPSGSYASVTDQKHFVYDTATVNGTAMVNATTRLAEAYTGISTSKKTDLGFSYSARGEVTDVWESTPNSAGYYHVTSQYLANKALNTISGLTGLPTITYGVDGEGRPTTVSAATGQNPVTASTYNVASQVTGLTFGSGDSDAYQYDNNTGRTTKYTFNMGTGPATQVGTLTWNPNGTLGQLQIADQINPANSQNCTFGYDDLVRITSANCPSVWSQTFGFDPFGNLKKTGSAQFQPTYTGESGAGSPTNQYYNITGGANGVSTYYDSNGNLKYDVTHSSYTWDADGNNLSVDGSAVTMIYDALDRMIEQTRGSSHTQIVYGPYGMKLALMNGQTLVNAFVKLPGGARAVYGSSGLAYYRHADHLGSSRLATTPTRTKYYDVAYAPYGEDYDGSGTQDLAFTDENQDTVNGGWSSNLYDFMMREYRTAHGRWTSPDPAGLGAVNPSDPQSWNRYAYVDNNPLTYIDPDGTTVCAGVFCFGWDDGFGNPQEAPEDLWGEALGSGMGMGMFGGENSINYPLGSGNPLTDLWQALGLPSLPCQSQFGPWCDPGMLPNPWILDQHLPSSVFLTPAVCDTSGVTKYCSDSCKGAGAGVAAVAWLELLSFQGMGKTLRLLEDSDLAKRRCLNSCAKQLAQTNKCKTTVTFNPNLQPNP